MPASPAGSRARSRSAVAAAADLRTPRGLRDAVSIDMRTSADGATWSEWSAAADDDDLFDADRNEHYAAPLPATDGARFAQYRAWLTGGDVCALARVGIT